jgi:hypothetical protein
VLGLVVAFVALVVAVRILRRRALPSGDEPGDNRLFGRGPTDGPLHAFDDGTKAPTTGPDGAAGTGLWSATGWSLPQADDDGSAALWGRPDPSDADPERRRPPLAPEVRAIPDGEGTDGADAVGDQPPRAAGAEHDPSSPAEPRPEPDLRSP